MKNDSFETIKAELYKRPKKITFLDNWLFITINTAKSIIDNTAKSKFNYLNEFTKCNTTKDVQQVFDTIQGKFGSKNFSQRHSYNYRYLCSLVAEFSKMDISEKSKKLIDHFIAYDKYLLYEL